MGGNRSGKSHMGYHEDVWVATGTHPWVKPPIPNRGRIGVTDFKVLENVTWPTLSKIIPIHSVEEYVKGAKGLVTGVRFKNGSYFDIMSYEQLAMKWESVDLDWVHFDEPPPMAIWNATRPRLIDRDGRVWFTLTPLEEPWLFEEIWEKCGSNARFWGMMVDMRRNPYLSAVAVQAFVDEVTEDDYEARVEGKFRHLTGKVFKAYTDEFPYVVTPDQVTIDRNWPRLCVLDPHEKTKWCIQWYANDEQNDTIYRFDELRFDPQESLDAFGNAIRNKELLHNAKVLDHMRISDSYGSKPLYNKGGSSLLDEIREIAGLDFRVCDKSDQKSRLWDLIYRYQINSATRLPRLVTFADCVEARREIKLYVWDKHRTKAGQWSEEKQTPVKKNDHAISCDMYMSAEWPSTFRYANPLKLFEQPPPSNDDREYWEEGQSMGMEAMGIIDLSRVRRGKRILSNLGGGRNEHR